MLHSLCAVCACLLARVCVLVCVLVCVGECMRTYLRMHVYTFCKDINDKGI